MRREIVIIITCLILILGLNACRSDDEIDREVLPTEPKPTIDVEVTQTAPESMATQVELSTETPTSTFVLPTEFPTATLSPTDTPFPTETPIPTAIPVLSPTPTDTPTATPIPCDQMQFVNHVTGQEGAIYPTGTLLTKTWRVKNSGTCIWTEDYDLVFVSGHQMSGPDEFPLPANVLPGQIVDISVKLKAPREPGEYEGFWTLRNDVGVLFGDTLVAKVKSFDADSNFALNLALTYCTASWSSGATDLSCPGDPTSPQGSVVFLDKPDLENRKENEPALWVRPNQSSSGWVSGIYPPIEVVPGDHFQSWIGCLKGSNNCEVIFQLDYQVGDGPVRNLGSWQEEYDGNVTKIDLDLTPLANQSVKFILTVILKNNRPDEANAFWFVPRIDRP